MIRTFPPPPGSSEFLLIWSNLDTDGDLETIILFAVACLFAPPWALANQPLLVKSHHCRCTSMGKSPQIPLLKTLGILQNTEIYLAVMGLISCAWTRLKVMDICLSGKVLPCSFSKTFQEQRGVMQLIKLSVQRYSFWWRGHVGDCQIYYSHHMDVDVNVLP